MATDKQAPSIEHITGHAGDYERHRHPAFGLASVNKQQCSTAEVLFGSDLHHRTIVSLKLHTAYSDRHLNMDWVHEDRMVVEVHMSEAQWASLITSQNGIPVPVTFGVRAEEDAGIMQCPKIERTETATETYEREMRERCEQYLQDAQTLVEELARCAAEGKAGKGQLKELHEKAKSLSTGLPATMGFIQKQFAERMAKTVDAGKIELEAFATQVTRNAGLEALRGSEPKLLGRE